jgi:hypothetical protein
MTFHQTTAKITFILLLITASTFLFLARAFGNSPRGAIVNGGKWPDLSTPSLDDSLDLRLIGDTVDRLRRIHTDSMDVNVPQAAKPLLATLKHQLRDLVANRLRFAKRQVSTQQIQARTIVDLSNLGLINEEEGYVVVDAHYIDRGYDYGDIEGIIVTRPHYDIDVIAVTTTVGICCGQDTSLYLFKYEDEEWKLWLADEKNDYDRIDAAQELFVFGLSWPDDNKNYFVVTASVNPWCSSNWQSIRYRVLRPSTKPYEPAVLLNREETIYLGGADPPYRLEVDDSSFTLRFYGRKYQQFAINGDDGDTDDESLKEVVRYRVKGNAVVEK